MIPVVTEVLTRLGFKTYIVVHDANILKQEIGKCALLS